MNTTNNDTADALGDDAQEVPISLDTTDDEEMKQSGANETTGSGSAKGTIQSRTSVSAMNEQISNNFSPDDPQEEAKKPKFLRDVEEIEVDTNDVDIEVCNPTVKEAKLGKYVCYQIKGKDAKGEFVTTRRYNDFFVLRNVLLSRWPGIYIPSIPPKQTSGRFEKEFIEYRRKRLQTYLVKTSKIAFLYESEELHSFLKGISDVEKTLPNFPKPTYEILRDTYARTFNVPGEVPEDENMEEGLKNFYETLKKTKTSLEKFRDISEASAKSFDQYRDSHFELYTTVEDFEELKAGDMSKEMSDSLFVKGKEKLREDMKDASNSENLNHYAQLSDWADKQVLETDALLDMYKGIETLEGALLKLKGKLDAKTHQLNNLQQGKKGFKGLLSRKSNDTLQAESAAKKESLTKDQEYLEEILLVLRKNLLLNERKRYESLVLNSYFQRMTAFVRNNVKHSEALIHVWSQVKCQME
eukprot:CAMPEP_0115004784 /NCGR_PEP_ID=MMETSP0216-20121206/19458_1 /TAXON_ID=223996 /ORGANISM="Protocruzia adherens, Strain Boccale" /LENGTH=469 /DNA_ID=CAMNT_0002370937 /DNA_START=71 /DNA_END=1480 /DNA_ORIENTATION=+